MNQLQCNECFTLSNDYHYSVEIEQCLLNHCPSSLMATASLNKLIRQVANTLKLTPFETATTAWLLTRTPFESNRYQALGKENEVLLYFLTLGYYAKAYLSSEAQAPIEIDDGLLNQFPCFKVHYKTWQPHSPLSSMQLSEANKICAMWTVAKRKVTANYNHMVDRLLQLSKSYNVSIDEEPRKKRKSSSKAIRQAQVIASLSPAILHAMKQSQVSQKPSNTRQSVGMIDQQRSFVSFNQSQLFNNAFLDRSEGGYDDVQRGFERGLFDSYGPTESPSKIMNESQRRSTRFRATSSFDGL